MRSVLPKPQRPITAMTRDDGDVSDFHKGPLFTRVRRTPPLERL